MAAAMTRSDGVMKIETIIHAEPPRLMVLFDNGRQEIAKQFADALGCESRMVESTDDAMGCSNEAVLAMDIDNIESVETLRQTNRILITARGIEARKTDHPGIVSDYEFLYQTGSTEQREIVRFLKWILGLDRRTDALLRKEKSTMFTANVLDLSAVLPKMEILTVGADALELQVDFRKDPATGKTVPSVDHVGEQVALLRRHSDLPIVFSANCFKGTDALSTYEYLHKAIQWGCEFIEVDLTLGEEFKQRLSATKGHTKIISSFYDFSGQFHWASTAAQQVLKTCGQAGDAVKMVALVEGIQEHYELEHFRSLVPREIPFIGLNVGKVGQLSRALNNVLTPIAHPLMPTSGRMDLTTVATINSTLSNMAQFQGRHIYVSGDETACGLCDFFKKCCNEFALPLSPKQVERLTPEVLDSTMIGLQFGGAYCTSPAPAQSLPETVTVSEAASSTGQFNVISVTMDRETKKETLFADNTKWQGIRTALTLDFLPDAFHGRPALVLAQNEAQAASALHALSTLDTGQIYTIGFHSTIAGNSQQLHDINELGSSEIPFAVISALPAGRSHATLPILEQYKGRCHQHQTAAPSIVLDLANLAVKDGEDSWVAYGCDDVNAFALSEALLALTKHNVSANFVKMTAGRALYSR